MGIARRKAGTDVNCPNCQQTLTVPSADDPDLSPVVGEGVPAPVAAPAAGRGNPFERSDFEIPLRAPVREPAAAPPRPAPAPLPAPAALGVERVRPPGPVIGLTLTPTQVTVLTVAGILLLAVAFGAGLLVGRYLLS
jgi:hypothetical protein